LSQKFKFEINFSFSDGSGSAIDVLNLYGNQIRDDIDQVAWNLCDCDDEVQSEKFGDLVLLNWDEIKKQGHLHVNGKFAVNALEEEFINQVVDEYMDGFADFIDVTLNGLYSRSGERASFNPKPIAWDVSIK